MPGRQGNPIRLLVVAAIALVGAVTLIGAAVVGRRGVLVALRIRGQHEGQHLEAARGLRLTRRPDLVLPRAPTW